MPAADQKKVAVYRFSYKPEQRGDNLAAAAASYEALINAYLETKGRSTVGATFAQLVQDNGVKPLNLKEDPGLDFLSSLSSLSLRSVSFKRVRFSPSIWSRSKV